MDKAYIAIDLKSFYASVECADRKYDPLTTNLVVADLSRTEKTICLAVSPSLKKHGISGRARLFEVIKRVKEVNQERFRRAIKLGVLPKDEKGHYHFTSSSFDAEALENDPALELSYIVAPPRMLLYEKISTQVFSVYSKYISPEDIHVYSIDEVFIDATPYLATYHTDLKGRRSQGDEPDESLPKQPHEDSPRAWRQIKREASVLVGKPQGRYS